MDGNRGDNPADSTSINLWLNYNPE